MKDKNNEKKNSFKGENKKNEIKIIKEEEIEEKENISSPSNTTISTKDKTKDNKNKNNGIKSIDNQKNKSNLKNNNGNNAINEKINQINERLNNFNYSNPNSNTIFHNRYYSSNTSNHIFRNFIKKANYNKNRDNLNENHTQNDVDTDDDQFSDNRPFSLNSRLTNNSDYINYFLGNENINPFGQKGFIDPKKKDGFFYKKYNRNKRNNFVKKNIYFSQEPIEEQKDLNQCQIIQNMILNNTNIQRNYMNMQQQFLNNLNLNANRTEFPNLTINNMKSAKQNLLHMNDILILDNLDNNIQEIKNQIFNFISSQINLNYNNNNSGQNLHFLHFDSNSFSPPIKPNNPGIIDFYKSNNSNIVFNNLNFNMNGSLYE